MPYGLISEWQMKTSYTGRRIEKASEGITLQIEKKGEPAGALNAYIYLIMDGSVEHPKWHICFCGVLDY